MDNNFKKLILEELKKSDVKSEITSYIDSDTFKKKVEKMIIGKLKDSPELEQKVLEITKNVLIQLYKTLYNKRNFWVTSLKNSSN